MKAAPTAILLLGLVGAILSGCAAEAPAPPESTASQESAKAAASNWTPEQTKKFAELNKEARGEGKNTEGYK